MYKKGDRQLFSNYRSISLTSVFCKISEKIVRDQMLDLMNENNVIPANQHGFVPKRSVMTNLIKCIDDWSNNIDKGMQTDVVHIDFSKCFSSVSHVKLLHKLEKLGFNGLCIKWLTNFICDDRQQFVYIDGTCSTLRPVRSGVAEGSVFGPLCYVASSLDMYSEILHSTLSTFADDSKLYKCIRDHADQLLLQMDLNRLIDWAEKWQLKINVDKTKCLVIGKQKFVYKYKLHNEIIEQVDSFRDLGVIIQSNLTFTLHVNNLLKSAYFVIRQIFLNFKNHEPKFYRHMYVTYVRPILESFTPVWYPNLCFNSKRVENVQRYFTKRIYSLSEKPYNERLENLF